LRGSSSRRPSRKVLPLPPVPSELFLSHASPDRAFADALGQELNRHQVPFWYSRKDVQGAQQWHDEIGAALDRCDWFAVVLSPEAVGSVWVKRELLFVLEEQRYQGRIVPLLYRPCEHKKLSWVLRSIEFIDFSRQSFEAGCRELVRIWDLDLVLPAR
jgi:hypothetical protein